MANSKPGEKKTKSKHRAVVGMDMLSLQTKGAAMAARPPSTRARTENTRWQIATTVTIPQSAILPVDAAKLLLGASDFGEVLLISVSETVLG